MSLYHHAKNRAGVTQHTRALSVGPLLLWSLRLEHDLLDCAFEGQGKDPTELARIEANAGRFRCVVVRWRPRAMAGEPPPFDGDIAYCWDDKVRTATPK